MELLGDRNWYFPAWLNWLPKVDTEGNSVGEATSTSGSPRSARKCRIMSMCRSISSLSFAGAARVAGREESSAACWG